MNNQNIDLLIIGGAAVACSAAIYAARRKVNFKVVTTSWGGEVANSGQVGNYPGFNLTTGLELAGIFKKQLEYNKVEIEEGVTIDKIMIKGEGEFICSGKMGDKDVSYKSKAIIIGTGVHPRELNIKGEKELKNRGISYCSTCDGPLFRNKIVATIGGGNSALESALLLKELCPKVYLLTINEKLMGETVYIEKLEKAENVEIITNAQTQEFIGEQVLQKLTYLDLKTNKTKELEIQGAFVHIGVIPNSDFLPPEIDKNDFGEVITNKFGETSVSGIFAAGDVTDTPFKQIAIATGQGVTAVLRAIQYLDKIK